MTEKQPRPRAFPLGQPVDPPEAVNAMHLQEAAGSSLEPLLQARQRVLDSPGREAYRRIDALLSSYTSYAGNYREFMLRLDAFETLLHKYLGPLSGENTQDQNRTPLELQKRDLVRTFHNLVASVGSLVDHTRRLVSTKHYKGTPVKADLTQRVSTMFAASVQAQVVQSLRNYSLHYGPPPFDGRVAVKIEKGKEESVVSAATLTRHELLAWKSWSTAEREFLTGASEELDVRPLVETYNAKVADLYHWLVEALAEHHRAELDELDDLLASYNRLVTLSSPDGYVPRTQPLS